MHYPYYNHYRYPYPYHVPYYNHYPVYGYGYYGSQVSNISQNLYNLGYQAGVSQNAIVNQFGRW